MASNFKIVHHMSGECIHLELVGDFDENSADELLDVMRDHRNRTKRLLVHTDGLEHVDDSGEQSFRNNFYTLPSQSFRKLWFSGKHAHELSPAKSLVLK